MEQTTQFKISNKLEKKIIEKCQNANLGIFWDYRDELDNSQIAKILEEGVDSFETEIYEMNIDYMFDQFTRFLEEILLPDVEEELMKEFKNQFPNQDDCWYGNEMKEFLKENYEEFLNYDTNIHELIGRTREINCLIPVYSNYDCTNSFDTLVDEMYLKEVYRRVQKAVHLRDYMYEFRNGAYGGSLFCFVFQTSLEKLIQIKEDMGKGKSVLIPKGTQFGFFSSGQGAGSVFEKTTYKDFQMPIQEPNQTSYDSIDVIADCEQHYSMQDVYGGITLDEQNIQIIK